MSRIASEVPAAQAGLPKASREALLFQTVAGHGRNQCYYMGFVVTGVVDFDGIDSKRPCLRSLHLLLVAATVLPIVLVCVIPCVVDISRTGSFGF